MILMQNYIKKKKPELVCTHLYTDMAAIISQLIIIRNDRVYLRLFRNTVAIKSFIHHGTNICKKYQYQ